MRDSLLARDADARAAGAGLVNRILILGAFAERIPGDRLLKTGDAARLTGLSPQDFLTLALERGVVPMKSLPGGSYWRARSVYQLIEE